MIGDPLRRLGSWLARRDAETSRLIVGSTGSGKSEGELVDLVRLADRGDSAVVLLDGHGTLALRAAGHWVTRGHENRLVYEPLSATDRVLAWPMLMGSPAADASRRRLEDAETRDDVAQCFLAQRNLATLADKPYTKEWLEAAIDLCLSQPGSESLTSLLHAFRVGSAAYERLLERASDPRVVEKFRGLERLYHRSAVQYEVQTGASRRLLELVCTSEVARLRCREGQFRWYDALLEKKLIAFDGGGVRSREIKRALFLLVSMQVINAVRRHSAQTRQPLPVVLVLEEAGALGLVTPFVQAALQELRKAGLSIHLLTQSSLDFGDASAFETLLANTPWQAWYQSLSPADQELGAKVMANPTFDEHSVHFRRVRAMPDGVLRMVTESHALSSGMQGRAGRHERRRGVTFLTRHRQLEDEYYKTPALHEQGFRTQLATLRIGERLVRDRLGVRRERVRQLRPPRRLRSSFEEYTREAIARVRRQPIYLRCSRAEPHHAMPSPANAAAARLRLQSDGSHTG